MLLNSADSFSGNFNTVLIETLATPVYAKDISGKYIACNNAFAEKILGIPPEQIAGKTMFDFPDKIPTALAEEYKKHDDTLLKTPAVQRYESDVRCADGIMRHFLFNKSVFFDSENQPAGIIGIMTDITEKKKQEYLQKQLIHISEIFFKSTSCEHAVQDVLDVISESLHAYACIFPESTVTMHNNLFFSENCPKNWEKEFTAKPPVFSLENEISAISRTCTDSAEISRIFQITGINCLYLASLHIADRKYGVIIVLENTEPLFSEYAKDFLNTAATFISSFMNSCELQREKKILSKKLFDTHKISSLSSLATKIVQSFHKKISAIDGYTNMLMLSEESESRKILLRNILNINSAATKFAEQLSLFSQKYPSVIENINVNSILFEICRKMQAMYPSMEISFQPQRPLHSVNGDSSLIYRMLENIVTNSVEACNKKGTVSIKTFYFSCTKNFLKKHPDAEFPEYICIQINDTGPGISPELRRMIFEPFFSTKKSSSCGLGLAISHSIILSHGGFIEAGNTPSYGAEFFVYLPKAFNSDETFQEKKPAILAVDDDDATLELLGAFIEEAGFRSIKAGSGRAAIQQYEKNFDEIQAVILDFIMPVMDGKETFIQLKKIDPAVKVMLSTACTDDTRISELMELGVQDALIKPFNYEMLADKLKNLVAES